MSEPAASTNGTALPAGGAHRRSRSRRAALLALLALALEAAAVWLRAGRLGGRLIVRCRAGHLFQTIWIPGVSLKSLRLGPWRLQRCPVGEHWSLVVPVRESALTRAQLLHARRSADLGLP